MTTEGVEEDLGIFKGSIVVVNLHSPREKVWGIVRNLSVMGVTIRGIDLASFEDWVTEVAAGGEEMTMGLATFFFPMHRLERILLDTSEGAAKSCCQVFEERTKLSVYEYMKQSR
ncbi:MAG: hypothetical protein U0166_25265 [Acidobacteriota bacterium]